MHCIAICHRRCIMSLKLDLVLEKPWCAPFFSHYWSLVLKVSLYQKSSHSMCETWIPACVFNKSISQSFNQLHNGYTSSIYGNPLPTTIRQTDRQTSSLAGWLAGWWSDWLTDSRHCPLPHPIRSISFSTDRHMAMDGLQTITITGLESFCGLGTRHHHSGAPLSGKCHVKSILNHSI